MYHITGTISFSRRKQLVHTNSRQKHHKVRGERELHNRNFQKFQHIRGEENDTVLAKIANHGLAKSTWSTYKTAERLLLMCQKQEGHRMELPLSENDVIVFVGWLIVVRKLKATTINGYLAGIRQLHIVKGINPPELRSNLVTNLVKGQENIDNIKTWQESAARRLPMTMPMMRMLKEQIRTWEEPLQKKLLMWAIATLAFHGAFRIHEILARQEREFDPDFTLLTEDVKLKQEGGSDSDNFLEIKIKCPKENKTGKATIIDVYETKGTLCPVKAFTRWREKATTQEGLPLFREENGRPVTGATMNSWIKDRLKEVVNYEKGRFSSHSFRIGLATTLAMKGYTDEDIKEAGRWNSNTHEIYMRLPRNKRNGIAKKSGKLK